jgi:hypothetical protein
MAEYHKTLKSLAPTEKPDDNDYEVIHKGA